MEVIQSNNLGEKISNWYVKNGRQNLPWRYSISPYRVWISEIMLQQTQVNTAIAYFERFMAKYPDLQTIKKASEDDIYNLWSGLGYYRRASFIFQAKELIHAKFKGEMPDNYNDLMSLPGVGKSTAGAILSIAFNKPYPILDANVKKVISRIFFKKNFEEKIFWNLSADLLDKKNIFNYTISDVIKLRDSIGKVFLPGRNPESFMMSEKEYLPYQKKVSYYGTKMLETRGTWEVKGDFMGGPFLNYLVEDKLNDRVLFIEGFVFAPSKRKRDNIIEIEAIIKSLKFIKEFN